MVPPAVSGEVTGLPYAGVSRTRVSSRVPTTSQGASSPLPNRARWSTAAVASRLSGRVKPTPIQASLAVLVLLVTRSRLVKPR
jgi:hypothetical protein